MKLQSFKTQVKLEENKLTEAMAAPLLTLNSLLPSQSLFNEIQSIHETGFFHELDSYFICKDGNTSNTPAQVNITKDVVCLRSGELISNLAPQVRQRKGA